MVAAAEDSNQPDSADESAEGQSPRLQLTTQIQHCRSLLKTCNDIIVMQQTVDVVWKFVPGRTLLARANPVTAPMFRIRNAWA